MPAVNNNTTTSTSTPAVNNTSPTNTLGQVTDALEVLANEGNVIPPVLP